MKDFRKFWVRSRGEVVKGGRGARGCAAVPLFSSRSVATRKFSATVFPSGDFSVGVIPPARIGKREKEYEEGCGSIDLRKLDWEYMGEEFHEYYLELEKTDCPPNLVNQATLSHARKIEGLKGITSYGRKMLASGAVLLQQRWGLKNTGFATLTVPSLPPEQMRIVCQKWGEVQRQFFQMLRRHWQRRQVEFDYVCCSEIQERRYRETGEIGLHLHFLYQAREKKSRQWLVSANQVRSFWMSALANVLRTKKEDLPQARCNLQVVKSNAASYLGKYISKGGKVVEEIAASEKRDCLPSRWWSMSKGIKSEINSKTICSSSRLSEDLFESASGRSGEISVLFCRPAVYQSPSRGTVVCGYSGRVKYEDIVNKYCSSLDSF